MSYADETVLVIALRQLIGIAVPVFIALSGYFTTKTLNHKNRHSQWDYIKKHIKKLYLPILIWSIPAFLISLHIGQSSFIIDILMLLIGGYSIYYFVILLIQFYLLAPFLRHSDKALLFISIVISLAVVFSETYIFPQWNSQPLIVSHGLFPGYLMFYVLGAYYANGNNTISNMPLLYLLCGICLVLSVMESYYKLNHNYSSPMGVKASVYLLALFVCMIIFNKSIIKKYKSTKFSRLISFLGFISLSLYLIHGYIIPAIARFSFIAQSWFLSFITTLAVTYLIYRLLLLLIPKRSYPIIGLVVFTKNQTFNEQEQKL